MFGWLVGKTGGLYLVRVFETLVEDHCVLVRGSRWVIVDSAERYPIELNEFRIMLCGAVDEKRLKLGEMHAFVVQMEFARKKKWKAKVVVDLTE